MQTEQQLISQAAALIEGGRYEEAINALDYVISQNPFHGVALFMAGTAYGMAGKNGLAVAILDRAAVYLDGKQDLKNIKHAAMINMAASLRIEGHNMEACRILDDILRADPNNADALNNMASLHINSGEPHIAERLTQKAMETSQTPEIVNNHVLSLLEQGKWSEAWPLYDRRMDLPTYHRRSYDAPQWDGTKTGTLVLHGEQGLGDEIMFLTLAAEIKPLVDRLVVEASPRLLPLLRRSLACEVYGSQEEVKEAVGKIDAFCPMPSALRFFRKTSDDFARSQPYLKADPLRVQYWRDCLKERGDGPFYALAWSGGTKRTHAENRNPPIELFLDLLNAVKGTFVSVQYTKGAALQAEAWGIPHWQRAIDDIDETAALIAACDATVSVAQTALHIAGALGKPTFGVIGAEPAWRYQLSGETMIWYPTVRLLRGKRGDWSGTMRAAIEEIKVWHAKNHG